VRKDRSMAYDEDLADRVRDAVAKRATFDELKMFGGLGFMVNTHMACGVMAEGILLRVGAEGHADAIGRGAQEFAFTGRPMTGFVIVPTDLLGDDRVLDGWVGIGVAFALAQPPKPPKVPKAASAARPESRRRRQ
jgi:TfoX/Sxy family transcriptional regulator of competence genes